jgi:hypothetical protein
MTDGVKKDIINPGTGILPRGADMCFLFYYTKRPTTTIFINYAVKGINRIHIRVHISKKSSPGKIS